MLASAQDDSIRAREPVGRRKKKRGMLFTQPRTTRETFPLKGEFLLFSLSSSLSQNFRGLMDFPRNRCFGFLLFKHQKKRILGLLFSPLSLLHIRVSLSSSQNCALYRSHLNERLGRNSRVRVLFIVYFDGVSCQKNFRLKLSS